MGAGIAAYVMRGEVRKYLFDSFELFKGTIMQIWKSSYKFVFV